MSEDFSSQLSDIAERALGSIRPPGAAEARRRGRQQTVRLRASVSVLCLALLGGGVGIAAATSANPGHTPVPVTASGTATPAPSVPSATSVPATGIVPNLSRYVAGAWLGANRVPLGTTITWQAQGGDNPVGPDVFKMTTPNQIWVTAPCATAGFTTGLTGMQQQVFQPSSDGNDSLGGSAVATAASQDILFYQDPADASTAWDAITSGYGTCDQKENHVLDGVNYAGSTLQTVAQSDAVCWSDLMTTTGGGASTSRVFHDCYVRYGTLIESVNLMLTPDTSLTAVDFTAADTATLQAMRQTLSVYQG